MQLREFFQKVITAPEGNFCLAVGPTTTTGWREEWFCWPKDVDRIVARATELGPDNNVYFSSYLYDAASSLKEHVLPSRTIQADLDEADATQLPRVPTILVQTSPGRHQAYWLVSDGPLDKETHEILSRKVTYSIPLCDRSGWPIGRKVRVPFTNNFKYADGPKPISIVGDSLKEYDSSIFEMLSDAEKPERAIYESGFIESSPVYKSGEGPNVLLSKFKEKIHPEAFLKFGIAAQDRSRALFFLMCELFRAGATREEVFLISKGSANNKFAHLRYHADRELSKDVLRAEQVNAKQSLDPKTLVAMIRRKPAPKSEKMRMLFEVVRDTLKTEGAFLNAGGGLVYYLRREDARPIRISHNSDQLNMLLDARFGMNRTEGDTHYVNASIYTHGHSLPEIATNAQLTHYDKQGKFLLLHTGRADVIKISADSIERVKDGAYNVIFPWNTENSTFVPKLDSSTDPENFDWAKFLFVSPVPTINGLNNVVGLDEDEALALLKVWFMFLLFRDLSASRPIIAFLGQPGCLSGETKIELWNDSSSGMYEMALSDLWKVFGDTKHRWYTKSLVHGQTHRMRIADVIKSGVKQTYTVKTTDAAPFRATADHRFMTPDGFVPLSNLSVGDMVAYSPLLGARARTSRIESIELEGYEETYDLTMAHQEFPNFLVNGVVVHNSGKTTVLSKLYALLYGPKRGLNSVTSAEDFDIGTSDSPFLGLDNVESWEKWLPDRLALSAKSTEVIKRLLYTDGDTYVMRRTALVGFSAFNPKITREDVVDRLLVFAFSRLPFFHPEDEVYDAIHRRRNDIWGAIVKDAQKVLQTCPPRPEEVPQFRIADFARVGVWIARALNCESAFKEGLTKTKASQRSLIIEEESMLVTALHTIVSRGFFTDYMTAGQIWHQLEMFADDPVSFKRMYHNSVYLGKKFFAMQEALTAEFDVTFTTRAGVSGRLWQFKEKSSSTNGESK